MTARYGGITRLVQTLQALRHFSWGIAILQVGYRKQEETKGFVKKHTAGTDFNCDKLKDAQDKVGRANASLSSRHVSGVAHLKLQF